MAIKKTTKQNKVENIAAEPAVNLDSKKIFSIKHPWITEKSYNLSAEGRYVFKVDVRTNKSEVKKAVKALYKVDPISVNIINVKGKNKYFSGRVVTGTKYKKAIVTLKEGQKIDVMPS